MLVQILTPAQYARWTIEVYPHPADWLALAHAVECMWEENGVLLLATLPAPSQPASATSSADDFFEGLSFSQASDFLQEFDFLQPESGQVQSTCQELLGRHSQPQAAAYQALWLH